MSNKLKTVTSDRRFWVIATGLIEDIIFAHTPAVFQTYEYVLRNQNYFPELSSDQLSRRYSLLYTFTSCMASLSMFAVGLLTDMIGFWYARFYLHSVAFLGLILLVFMSFYHIDNLAWVAIPFFVGNSHAFTRLYNFQCRIYPERTTFLMALQFIPITCAQLLYIPFKRMAQQGYMYIGFMACIPVSVLRTFVYCPKRNIYWGWLLHSR